VANPKETLEYIFKKHGGKTVTVSSLVGALVLLVQLGAPIPIPATEEYVDAKITQATKGLPYLVRSSLEKDLDTQYYLVFCMQQSQYQGAYDRMVREFRESVGEPYQPKSCVDLESRQIARR
jgi:hypothetical protein